jgi:hypothetical protein
VQSFQQVEGDLVSLTRPTGVGLGIEGGNPHLPHQALHPLAVRRETLIVQPVTNLATIIEGTLEVHLIDAAHQSHILIRGAHRLVIHRGPVEIQQMAPPGYRQGIGPVNHFLTRGP